ncbi:hypothetical protein Dimus_009790 [Dionaea muscipula]
MDRGANQLGSADVAAAGRCELTPAKRWGKEEENLVENLVNLAPELKSPIYLRALKSGIDGSSKGATNTFFVSELAGNRDVSKGFQLSRVDKRDGEIVISKAAVAEEIRGLNGEQVEHEVLYEWLPWRCVRCGVGGIRRSNVCRCGIFGMSGGLRWCCKRMLAARVQWGRLGLLQDVHRKTKDVVKSRDEWQAAKGKKTLRSGHVDQPEKSAHCLSPGSRYSCS